MAGSDGADIIVAPIPGAGAAGQAAVPVPLIAPAEPPSEPPAKRAGGAHGTAPASPSYLPTSGESSMDMSSLRFEINAIITKMGGAKIVESNCDLAEVVSEIFGRGRFLDRAQEFGLSAGVAYDLCNGWDLNIETHKQVALQRIGDQQPLFLVGSPRCTA